jgi:uncharacterized protein
VKTGQKIDAEVLQKIENCETKLFALGFMDFRVRVVGDCAKLQIKASDFSLFANQKENVSQILCEEFSDVVLDLKIVR